MPTTSTSSRGTIPDAVITSVKNNTSFLSLLKSYGVRVKKVGNGYKAVCPFHPDTTGSLSIDIRRNVFNCFGCGSNGNVIQFVMTMEKVSFPEAVEKLLAVKGARLEKAAKEEERSAPAPAPAALTESERQTILRNVLTTTTAALRNSKPGREYLEARGLDPLTLLDAYTLGLWNGNTCAKLAGSEKKKLAALGLLSGTTRTRALFENCIIFPFEKDGRITTIYGRKTIAGGSTTPHASPFDPAQGRHYLLPCKREGLFLPRPGLNPQRPVIITESVIDALSLFTAGVTNVVPLLGVNGFLADHLEYLKAQRFPMIYIALNGDEAGNKAAAQLKMNLARHQLPAQTVQLPDGRDINEMLCEFGPDKLKTWFTERTDTTKPDENPTVWEDDAGDTFVTIHEREYRIRGLSPVGMERLKVNVKVRAIDDHDTFYVDTLDLYHAKSRDVFVNHTARTFDTEPARIAREINILITVLEKLRLRNKTGRESSRARYEMSDTEKKEALAYLRSPKLLERIRADFAACGMVGNCNQNLLSYLGALSRLTDHPFGILIVSRSGAGKSFLQDMVASFTPEESLLRMTRLTGQSLFYQGSDGLKHKLLTIEEDEGMQEAMYSIRTLLSSQKLTLHGLKTDAASGEFRAFENTVHGPASVMISTTNVSAFTFENVNRFFVVFLDESRDQTRAILAHQRRMAGLEKIRLKESRKRIERLHRTIQRLLKPVMVVNRIGTGIEYPEEILNTRREQTKTEALIETVTLLHQYQRPVKNATVCGVKAQYIEVTRQDLEAVHRIAGDTLRQSLDELPRLCRDLLEIIHTLVNDKYTEAAKEKKPPLRWQITFTRKELAERSRWSRWHLEEHIKELEQAGYIVQRMGRKGQRYSYSLVEERMPPLPTITRAMAQPR